MKKIFPIILLVLIILFSGNGICLADSCHFSCVNCSQLTPEEPMHGHHHGHEEEKKQHHCQSIAQCGMECIGTVEVVQTQSTEVPQIIPVETYLLSSSASHEKRKGLFSLPPPLPWSPPLYTLNCSFLI